jgi:hypothetical protein
MSGKEAAGERLRRVGGGGGNLCLECEVEEAPNYIFVS